MDISFDLQQLPEYIFNTLFRNFIQHLIILRCDFFGNSLINNGGIIMPPYWLFTVTVVYQGEDKLPVIWGFHPIEMTPEKRQELGDDLSVYLNDELFTR